MNVVLDSNIYASDYRMEGIPFRNLFDYLRKTSSSLVLFRIVQEEVAATYARELKSRYKEAVKSWDAYRHLVFPEQLAPLEEPDFLAQEKQLRGHLMKPLEGINVVYESHTSNISIDEVYLRGINRIRPANAKGEELRDVILWLSTLAHAKASNRAVAFISGDSGFWQENDVHPEIRGDVETHGVSVRLYRSIKDFVEANLPPSKSATAEWFSALLPLESVKTLIGEAVVKALQEHERPIFPFQALTIRAADFISSEFREGKIYEVASNVQFAEVVLAAEVLVNASTAQTDIWVTTTRPPEQPGSGLWLADLLMQYPPANKTLEAVYRCRGGANVSLRITNGVVSEAQVSSFEIEQIEKITEAETNA